MGKVYTFMLSDLAFRERIFRNNGIILKVGNCSQDMNLLPRLDDWICHCCQWKWCSGVGCMGLSGLIPLATKYHAYYGKEK